MFMNGNDVNVYYVYDMIGFCREFQMKVILCHKTNEDNYYYEVNLDDSTQNSNIIRN